MFVKLHYADVWHLNTATGGAYYSVQSFRGNSIYDPDLTGVGGTPSGYTEWAALYNKYRVWGSKIVVRAQPLTAVDIGLVGIRARFGEAAWASPIAIQQGLLELKKDTRVRHVSLVDTNNARAVIMKMYRSTSRMVGKTVKNDNDYAALFGANPTLSWFWDFCMTQAEHSATDWQAHVTVQITYYVELFDCSITYGD